MGSKIFLAGAAIGGGLVYLLDPQQGNRRRARLRDQYAKARGEIEFLVNTPQRGTRDHLLEEGSRDTIDLSIANAEPSDASQTTPELRGTPRRMGADSVDASQELSPSTAGPLD